MYPYRTAAQFSSVDSDGFVRIAPSRSRLDRTQPTVGFTVSTDRPFVEVMVAVEPELFRPASSGRRGAGTFFTSRAHGLLPGPGHLTYLLPAAFVVEAVAQTPRPSRLWYLAAAYPDEDATDPVYSVATERWDNLPYVGIAPEVHRRSIVTALGISVERLNRSVALGDGESADSCKQRWQRRIGGLPEDLRKALDVMNFDLATALAVHHGMRDAAALTDLLFYTKYWMVHGYCAIKPGTRLPDGGDPYQSLWQGLREKWVVPALARPSPPLAQKGGVVCTRHENKPAAALPDAPPVDVTGRYEQVVSAGAPVFLFRVNQAGKHIEARLTFVAIPGQDGSRPPPTDLFGELQSDGSFLLFSPTNPKMFGRLAPTAQGGAELTINGTKNLFQQVSAGPTLLGPLSQLSDDDALVKLYEQSPLSSAQIRHLVTALATAKIQPFLVDYFEKQPGGHNVAEKLGRRQSANRLDDYLAKVMNDRTFGISQKVPGDMRLARFYARSILTENRYTYRNKRSQLDWIQMMYSRAVSEDATLPAIANLLNLAVKPSGSPQTYKVTLRLTGGGFFLHGYHGTITIENTSEGRVWKKGEKHTFGCWLASFEWGGGVKIAEETTGTATSDFEWTPPDVPGPIRIAEAGAGISVGPLDLGGSAGFMVIEGSGYLPNLVVEFASGGLSAHIPLPSGDKDRSKKKKPSIKVGGHVGGSITMGRISSKPFPDIDYSTFFTKTDYAVERALLEDVHFCLDSALLTEDARQALRIVCATELPAFMSTDSHLTIIGHTDRSADAEYNLGLSKNRAQNTLQAIRDILDSQLGIPESNIKVEGKGETQAKNDKRPDHEKNPTYRRVDVILNARLVLTLRAQ